MCRGDGQLAKELACHHLMRQAGTRDSCLAVHTIFRCLKACARAIRPAGHAICMLIGGLRALTRGGRSKATRPASMSAVKLRALNCRKSVAFVLRRIVLCCEKWAENVLCDSENWLWPSQQPLCNANYSSNLIE